MRTNNISREMKIAASQNIKEKEYWLNQLSGEPAKSFFPYDHKETAEDERRFGIVNFQLNAELSANLIRISGKSDKRLHMILVAGLATLLNKYSGDKDIIVGMPIYKQEIGETKVNFINTVLPLRLELEPHMTFKQLILQVKQTTIEAARHQNYPMKTLLYKLNIPSSDSTGFGLFDATILLENIHCKSYLEDINYNMLFSFLKTGESIQGQLEYNASLYEEATIQGIVNHYRQLFQVVLSNLDIPLEEIDILPGEEKHRILFDFNDTKVDYPRDKTIHAWLETQIEKTPDKIAVTKNHQYLTYRGLNEKANQLAGLLREKSLKPEGVVGILMEPSLELIIGIVGILKAGGAYLPIDAEYPESRILSILQDSGVSILLTKETITKAMTFIALKDFKESNVTPLVTMPRDQIKDFDSLPFLDRTLIDYDKYHRYIGVAMAKHKISFQASRGCPYNCIYCHKIWPKNHVARSAENIFEEVKNCYDAGMRRFVFIDDVINLKKDNISRFLEKVIKSPMKPQLFFTNGLRGDILTREIIDLMVEAGAVNIDMALESASPRMQKLMRKHLKLEKFRENIHYIAEKYPRVILEMEMLIGYPTETEEEALMTLQFAKDIKWLHFPKLHILKFYPGSEMYQLAREKGISEELLERSTNLAFHELPETLPYSKAFTRQFQTRLMNEYFFNKERLVQVLKHQLKTLTEDELVQKYDSYLPMEIRSFSDILDASGLSVEELGGVEFLPPNHMAAPNFREKMKKYFPPPAKKEENALRVLLLDLSSSFSSEKEIFMSYHIEEPIGLAFLLTYIKKIFDRKICGKIGKARIDFDNFDQMKTFIQDFNPDLIGLRTLSYYKDFFHKSISLIRQWGINVPIITGGPYATSDYQLMLNDSNIDVAVLGEGELTLAHLLGKIIENDKKLPGDEVLKNIPGIAFIKKEHKASIKNLVRDVVLLDNIGETVAPYPKENPVHVNKTTDLLYMVSTSGSTGKPKSLMIEHRNLANLMNFQLQETGVEFNRVLQFASIGFDVSSQEIFSTLLAGGQLVLADSEAKRDVYRLLELMNKHHLNVIYWPPALLKYVFSEPEHRAIFPKSIQHIITAGESLIVTRPIREYLKENQVYLHNHYGPAETHVVTTFVLDPDGHIPELPPVGKPISNNQVYILDENKNIKPIGTVGELYIAGANVGRGYSDQVQLTTERFCLRRPGGSFCKNRPLDPGKNFSLEGTGGLAPLALKRTGKDNSANMQSCNHASMPTPHSPIPPFPHSPIYRTGDLARWLPDGNIEFIDRADLQVKIRGFRVEPGEIETRLMQIDFIKEAIVVDYKDTAGEKYLCAYIVIDSQKEAEISQIKDILALDLPGYMIPSSFVRLENIPVTANGKVNRKALPKPEFEGEATYVPPRDDLDERLTAIWSDVLSIKKDSISIDSGFFELGGHSLKATLLITRIKKEFNIEMAIVEIFKSPSIREQAEYIKNTGEDIFWGTHHDLVLLRKKSAKAKHLFFVHDGSGEVEGYLEFCKQLETADLDFNCWGIESEKVKNYSPRQVTIEEIASEYIKKIKKLQDTGPYYIGGWSLGGTIAFEMVKQLEQENEKIAFLALVDSPPPLDGSTEKSPSFTLEAEKHFIKKYFPAGEIAEKLKSFTKISQVWSFMVDYWEKKNLDPEVIKQIIKAHQFPIVPNYEHLTIGQLIEYINRGRALYHARDLYMPGGKIHAPVHCFAAMQSRRPKEAWNNYCNTPIEIYPVPGDHFSMFKMPHVIEFAGIFAHALIDK